MKVVKKLLTIMGLGIILYAPLAAERLPETGNVYTEETNSGGIMPYADIIETKYRLNHGKAQYRRWNSTKGCWVDPEWMDL